MRLVELLAEDYTNNFISDMEDILIQAKARNIYEIPTKHIVDMLFGSGYSVNIDSILPVLSQSPMVIQADQQKTMIQGSDEMIGAQQSHNPGNQDPAQGQEKDAGEESSSRVADMAQSALDL